MKTLCALLLAMLFPMPVLALFVIFPTLDEVVESAEQIGIVEIVRATPQAVPYGHCDAEYTGRWIDSITGDSGLVRFAGDAGYYSLGKQYLVFLSRSESGRMVEIKTGPEFRARSEPAARCPDRSWLKNLVLSPIAVDYSATGRANGLTIDVPPLYIGGEEHDWHVPVPHDQQTTSFLQRSKIRWDSFCKAVIKRVATGNEHFSVAMVSQRFCVRSAQFATR